MPWIRIVSLEEAEGFLAKQYQQALERAGRIWGIVHALVSDRKTADLSGADRALCRFAEKLTLSPAEMSPADLELLRAEGFEDTAIHDATQVVAYFDYINRVADALGIPPEDFVEEWERPPGL